MRKTILPLFIVLCSIQLSAEGRTVTINECIEIALQNHPDYFISIEDQKNSVADYRIARSQKSIIVNGEIRTIETDKDTTTTNEIKIPGKDTYIGLFAGLTLNYNIYDPRRDYAEDMARAGIDFYKIKSLKTRMDIILEVKSAYYGYLLARNQVLIREEILKKNQKKTILTKQLFDGGSRPILDVSKSEVELAEAQLQYEMARVQERKMKSNLLHAMGLEDSDEIELVPEDISDIPDVTVSIDDLYRMSQIYSPILRMSVLEKRIARMKIDSEVAAHYPRVDLVMGAGYTLERIYGFDTIEDNFKGESWSPAFYGLFTISIPVYSGGRISAKIDSSESDYNKVAYKEKKILIQTKNQIRDYYKTLENMKKQMELAGLMVKNAERHLLLAQKSYDNGGGSQLELQDAELSVIKARIDYLEAKYNYMITLARLANIIGIGEEAICRDSERKQSQ